MAAQKFDYRSPLFHNGDKFTRKFYTVCSDQMLPCCVVRSGHTVRHCGRSSEWSGDLIIIRCELTWLTFVDTRAICIENHSATRWEVAGHCATLISRRWLLFRLDRSHFPSSTRCPCPPLAFPTANSSANQLRTLASNWQSTLTCPAAMWRHDVNKDAVYLFKPNGSLCAPCPWFPSVFVA